METGLVLGVVAVKEEAGLVGRAEERFWNNRPTEPIDHRTRVQRPATDFKVVVHGLRGEVEKLQVNPWFINNRRRDMVHFNNKVPEEKK